MKMLEVKVNLHEGFANRPSATVIVDKLPPRDEMFFRQYNIGGSTLYVGEQDGAVRFMIHSGVDDVGYGGAVFTLNLTTGRTIKIKGPWSSRAGVVNKTHRFPLVMDIRLEVRDDVNQFYTSATVGWLLSQGIRLGEFLGHDGEITFEVLDQHTGELMKPLSGWDAKKQYLGEVTA